MKKILLFFFVLAFSWSLTFKSSSSAIKARRSQSAKKQTNTPYYDPWIIGQIRKAYKAKGAAKPQASPPQKSFKQGQ